MSGGGRGRGLQSRGGRGRGFWGRGLGGTGLLVFFRMVVFFPRLVYVEILMKNFCTLLIFGRDSKFDSLKCSFCCQLSKIGVIDIAVCVTSKNKAKIPPTYPNFALIMKKNFRSFWLSLIFKCPISLYFGVLAKSQVSMTPKGHKKAMVSNEKLGEHGFFGSVRCQGHLRICKWHLDFGT